MGAIDLRNYGQDLINNSKSVLVISNSIKEQNDSLNLNFFPKTQV